MHNKKIVMVKTILTRFVFKTLFKLQLLIAHLQCVSYTDLVEIGISEIIIDWELKSIDLS